MDLKTCLKFGGDERQAWKMKPKKRSSVWLTKTSLLAYCLWILAAVCDFKKVLIQTGNIYYGGLPHFAGKLGFSPMLIVFIPQKIHQSCVLGTNMWFYLHKFWAQYKYLTEREKCQSTLKTVCIWNGYSLETHSVGKLTFLKTALQHCLRRKMKCTPRLKEKIIICLFSRYS